MKYQAKKVALFAIVFAMTFFTGMPFTQASSLGATGEINIAAMQEGLTASEPMSYDEMAQVISKDSGISLAEAKEILGLQPESRMIGAGVQRATYRTIASTVVVDSSYQVTMRFYCETSEYGGYWGIVKILNVEMDREYNEISKQFGGTTYVHLRSATTIFYIVNGDFYNNGTTNVSAGVDIGIDEIATIKFNVSSSSNHYKYVYKETLAVYQT